MKKVILGFLCVLSFAKAEARSGLEDLQQLADGQILQGVQTWENYPCYVKLEADRTGIHQGLVRIEVHFYQQSLYYFEIPENAQVDSDKNSLAYQYTTGDRTLLTLGLNGNSLDSLKVASKQHGSVLGCTDLMPLKK